MSKVNKKPFSFENDLNFENLSIFLNELGIASHPLTNEQKVCIEYPNILSESKNLDVLGDNLRKLETEGDKENKLENSELTLNLSKNKTYTIAPEKIYDKFKKKCPYSQEILINSLKIFVSIFNNFNDDIFKWNLEDYELFNSSNKIQFFLIKDTINNNININEKLKNLYEEHLENSEIKNNLSKSKNVEITQNDDFVDDFDDSKVQHGNNLMLFGENKNEDEIILRNIYFLINLFNLMNYFALDDFILDNIMRNISLYNSYIINDAKILLLIHFNLCVLINLTLSKQKVDNFLGISSTNKSSYTSTISSTMGPILGKTINFFSNINEKSSINNKTGVNMYIPSLFFIDFYFYENPPSDENTNESNKRKIIIINFILKTFLWTYFINSKLYLKIYIKIFNFAHFSKIKENMIINQDIKNSDLLNELLKNTNYVNLLNDNLAKEYLLLINADFKILNELKVNKLDEFFKIYFPIFLNCNMISFEINNPSGKFSLIQFIEELNSIIWLFKFYLKLRKYNFKKYTFTFLSNSFSLAIKKNKISKIEESYTKEITLFMNINNYSQIELIQHLSDINNFNAIYKLYKTIIKSCGDYKNYDIGIRLFKDNIINKELKYYFAMLVLKLENYIKSHKDIYKKLVLYENKIINPSNCVYLNIKKKLLKIKNKQNTNSKNENDLNISFKLKEKNEGGVLSKIDIFSKLKKTTNDSDIDKNAINLNNFYKSLGEFGLNHEEKIAIYNFVKETKYFFTEIVVFLSKNIFFKNKNENYDPLNVLQHFNNNKCFITINDMSFIDIYIYLTDSFDINFLYDDDKENKNDLHNPSIFFNAIISNIKVLKFLCKENFDNNHGHIQLRDINIILNKSTFLKNEYFNDYRSLFNENNNIFILDESTKINCIFGDTHISLISNIDEENLNDIGKNKFIYNDYFTAFYSIFSSSYDIIKFVNNKKIRKYNKLDIVYNKKILQIKDGKIQIKKFCKEEEILPDKTDSKKSNEIKIENKEEKNDNIQDNEENKINKENITNDNSNNEPSINNNENDLNIVKNIEENDKNKKNQFIQHNIFKIKELFQYQNSYPLISFMLINETEISNLSFLFYAFEELFLSKKDQQETKEAISRKLLKFFARFKTSKFIPIIFSEKYFNKFLLFFQKIINKKEQKLGSSFRESSKGHYFENAILFPLEPVDNLSNKISKILSDEKNILINLIKNIYLFNVKTNKYSKNKIGKLFKYNKIKDSMKEFGSKPKIINENIDNFFSYEINDEILDEVFKKYKKKSKLVEKTNPNNEENKNDISKEECLIF